MITKLCTILVILCMTGMAVAHAQMRIVVPFAPGGTTDVTARVLAQALERVTSQPVIVENRPGAHMQLALAHFLNQPADRTMFIANSGMLQFLHTNDSSAPLAHNPWQVLHANNLIAHSPMVLMLSNQMPPLPGAQMLDYLKQRQDQINIAVVGRGSSLQLASQLLEHELNTRFTSIPYTGASLALNDLRSGTIHMMFDSVVIGSQHTHHVRPFAVTNHHRSRHLSHVPTFTELGLDLVFTVWQGVFVSTQLDHNQQARLHSLVARALGQPDLVNSLYRVGFEHVYNLDLHETRQLIAQDQNKFTALLSTQ